MTAPIPVSVVIPVEPCYPGERAFFAAAPRREHGVSSLSDEITLKGSARSRSISDCQAWRLWKKALYG